MTDSRLYGDPHDPCGPDGEEIGIKADIETALARFIS
jgi:hypothetical protein